MMYLFRIGIIFSLLVLSSGCELFSTRAPEPPESNSSGGWQFPRDPEILLDNLRNAVFRRSSVDYLKSFTSGSIEVEGFLFIPDPEANANNPGIFNDWNIERERKHIETLFSTAILPHDSVASLSFDIDRETVLGDSANVIAQYEFRAGHVQENVSGLLTGRLEFKMLKGNDGGWAIQRWTDFRNANQPCWSDLKAQI